MLSRKPAALLGSVLLVSAVGFVSATGAAAQACCSAAPQAGPGSVSGQGVGSLFPGQGWIQASVRSLGTDEQFRISGAKEAYFNEGHLELESFQLTGAVGLLTGLEVWAEGVIHSVGFRDAATSSHRTGLGDLRVWNDMEVGSGRRELRRMRGGDRGDGREGSGRRSMGQLGILTARR